MVEACEFTPSPLERCPAPLSPPDYRWGMGVAMDQDDEVRLEEEARDLPDSIWFDLLNVVPLMTLVACALGTWLPPLF